MPKAKVSFYKITVEGAKKFPLDMLRYDACWPRTTEDSVAISRTLNIDFGYGEDGEKIELISYEQPTPERWASFGWRVVRIQAVSV